MEQTVKDALELALSNNNQDKIKLGRLLSNKSFDFFCIFIEYFAIRAKYKIDREKNSYSFSHFFIFSSCNLIIKTEKNPKKQIFFSFVYINDNLAVSLFEHKGRFKLKYTKYNYKDILNSLK
jgi:hypothetical protein